MSVDQDLSFRINERLGHVDVVILALRKAQCNVDGVAFRSGDESIPVTVAAGDGVCDVLLCPFLDPGGVVATRVAAIVSARQNGW